MLVFNCKALNEVFTQLSAYTHPIQCPWISPAKETVLCFIMCERERAEIKKKKKKAWILHLFSPVESIFDLCFGGRNCVGPGFLGIIIPPTCFT